MSVVLQSVTKSYTNGGTPAVKTVSFEAPSGAVTSLIGPSGAGKSTLLRLIAGLESPDAGEIHIAGADVTTRKPQERGVGLVFQNYALFENMTVAENVAFGLDVRKPKPTRAEIDERVHRLLKLVQLDSLAQRRPAQLSGGQRQRVAFARALAIEPKVLLLDEPFGALDARVRRDLRDWLVRLHDETKVTTVLVTHDQEEALEVSQHVVALLDGTVAQAGAPQDIYDNPASPEIASFLGANRVRGIVRSEAGDAFVKPQDVRLTRAPSDDVKDAPLAKVERVRVVGSRVKVDLHLKSNGDRVQVDVGRDEFEALGLNTGDLVLLDVRNARVFLNDFSI
jgi:sulfate/thiosulfate transport system ATP-binding protein